MEISKALQEEILAVQNKLKNAIRDHQICVGKLKDDPNNTDILGQIQEIHLHIVSLGRCQKQVVQRLRKEVEAFKAENANGAKVSIASLLGLNNNNHITNYNEAKRNTDVLDTKPSKEDYEDIVRNGDVPSPPRDNMPSKERSVSVETISGEDDVIEVSMDENSNEKQDELEKDRHVESIEKLTFLCGLGLITTSRCAELQNKRVERKRRSTANPQFVYSSLEMPTKRKRYPYLQSVSNVPQTRQTTARMNGPSPPPNKVSPPKANSPPTRTVTKSLIPVQKPTTRPNILRNVTENKVYVGKNKIESDGCQVQFSSTPAAKTVAPPTVSNKTVHIPGLPPSLTIERIESDSVVCINCRNPGILTMCENCTASYHVSCHSISPPPPRTCPKCASINEEQDGLLQNKKDEELEEKERERYELRERNSDLRLQVYELEKRSQLLGQSLQLQHRTRQELLGKQEKTQRSIKRLVDFIKLMQLRRNISSPPPSGSVSYHPQPSSSQSPRAMSPPRASISNSQKLAEVVRRIPSSNSPKTTCPTPPSSLTICHDRISPTSIPSRKCPTPINYQQSTVTSSQRNTSHTSSSRKSQSQQPDGSQINNNKMETEPKSSSNQVKVYQRSSTVNCQPRQVSMHTFNPTSPSPGLRCSSISNTSNPLATRVAKSQIAVQYQHSTVSLTPKPCPSQPTASWNVQHSTAGKRECDNREASSASTSCVQPLEPRISSCQVTMSRNTTSNCRSQALPVQKRQHLSSALVSSIGPEVAVFSTHCSQAITGPISSPIVLENDSMTRAQSSTTETCTNVSGDNSISIVKNDNWNQVSDQTSPRSNYSGEPSRSSSGT